MKTIISAFIARLTQLDGETVLLQRVADLALDAGLENAEAMQLFEYFYLREALVRTKGNQCKAAKLIGLHRNSLARKVDAFERFEIITRPRNGCGTLPPDERIDHPPLGQEAPRPAHRPELLLGREEAVEARRRPQGVQKPVGLGRRDPAQRGQQGGRR